jgi:ABC-type sugar transport system ATPase subunit
MVYVTHDQVEAMTLADRIVVMNGGRIAQAGKPLDLYYHPNNLFVAGFIGSPAMNILDAVVDRKDAGRVTLSGRCVAPFDLAAANFAAPAGAKLKIGVRPEHLSPEHLSPEHLSPEHLSPEHLSPEHLGPPRASGFKIAGVVELVERLGETSFAYVRLAEDVVVTAEMRGRDAPKAGEAISLGVAERDLHLFGEDGECVPIG